MADDTKSTPEVKDAPQDKPEPAKAPESKDCPVCARALMGRNTCRYCGHVA